MLKVILGPPGTGKTTTLLNMVDTYFAKGTQPDRIGFVSFTKKSVGEARDRAAARFNKPPDWFTYFRTIHSLAFRQLGMSTSEVMKKQQYVQFGRSIGLEITGYQQMDKEVYEMNRGDQMVFLESLSRMKCESYVDTYHLSNPDFSWEEFDMFIRAFKAYKKKLLISDFTDMLERYNLQGAVAKPKLDVLFIDEAQDLCALQWRIIEQMQQQSVSTYITGDDDQAIFRWSGADIAYFSKLAQGAKVLEQSYRLPKAVHKMALEIAQQIKHSVRKQFKPTKETGKVEHVQSIEDIDMVKGEWLLLVRNGYMERSLINHVRLCGFSYESRFDNPLEASSLYAALWWEKVRRNEPLTIGAAREIVSFTPLRTCDGLRGRPTDSTIIAEEFLRITGLNKDLIWHEALSKISYEDRGYYIAARKRGETLVGKPRIRISTIHGAKGGECQNVVVFTDLSKKTYNGMQTDFDDEARVFYVAVTRAKESLFIVQPQTNSYFTI